MASEVDEAQEDVESPSTNRLRSALSQFAFKASTPRPFPSPVQTTTTTSRPQTPRTPSRLKRKSSESTKDFEAEGETTPRKKKNLTYAPPETYEHLSGLPDCIAPNLDILFVGINPGIQSATTGHHFAHPTNQFYRALHESGLTDRRLDPSEDGTMPERYNLGLTNIVVRPSIMSTELSVAEKVAAVPELLARIARYRPRIACFIGREVAQAVETAVKKHKARTGTIVPKKSMYAEALKSPTKGVTFGPESSVYTSPLATVAPGFRMMDYKLVYDKNASAVNETLFFTAPSTSGRVTAYKLEDRVQLFKLLAAERDSVIAGTRETKSISIIPTSVYSLSSSVKEIQSASTLNLPVAGPSTQASEGVVDFGGS